MQLSNLSLAYLVAETTPFLENAFLNRVQELSNDTFKFRLRTKKGPQDLILAPGAFYFTQFKLPALKQTSGFGAFLRKRLEGKKIVSLKQHGLDRVVLFEFQDFFLIAELFAKGNLVLANKELEILSAYRKEHWSDRELRKGARYSFPSSRKLNPLNVSLNELKKVFSSSPKDVVRTLIAGLDVAPEAAEEVCFRLKIEKTLPAKELDDARLKKIISGLKRLYGIDLRELKPVLVESKKGSLLLPFPFDSFKGLPQKTFPSLSEAVDELFSRPFLKKRLEQEKEPQTKKAAAMEHSIAEQMKARERFENQIAENRASAELIQRNLSWLEWATKRAKELLGQGTAKKEIMYKINLESRETLKSGNKLLEVKKHSIVVELD